MSRAIHKLSARRVATETSKGLHGDGGDLYPPDGKKVLKKYGYPPDLQDEAVRTVIEQAETLSAI